jgi:hypothetical protein
VHVVVHNPYPAGGILDLGELGGRGLPPGDVTQVFALAPGRSSLACRSADDVGRAPTLRVDYEVVDDEGMWLDPTLACMLPTAPVGFSDPEVGPPRSTPEEAIRAWSGVLADTAIRQVGYPEEPGRRYVAELGGGEVLFILERSDGGQWRAAASQSCTSVPPSVREDPRPAQAWYDAEGIGDVRDALGRIEQRGEDEATPVANRVSEARMWCTDLELQSRVLGDVAAAPAPDLEALRQRALVELIAAGAACPADEAAVLAEEPFAATDAHVATATVALDDLRRLVEQGG